MALMGSVRNAVHGAFIVSVQVRVCGGPVLPQISYFVKVANENIVSSDRFYITSDLNTRNFLAIQLFLCLTRVNHEGSHSGNSHDFLLAEKRRYL